MEERKAKGEGEGQTGGEKGNEKGQGMTDVRIEDAKVQAAAEGAKDDAGDD